MDNAHDWDATDEHGLPVPKQYDGPYFDAREYSTGKYAEASTLDQKIAMRGQEAFASSVSPDDFEASPFADKVKVGIAELWAQSTWVESATQRDIDLEACVASVKKGDILEVRRCEREASEWEYGFYLPSGDMLPYSPFHDYDDMFFNQALDDCQSNQRLVCIVRDVECFGEDDGVPADPGFCWRVYSCKVTVYREEWAPELN